MNQSLLRTQTNALKHMTMDTVSLEFHQLYVEKEVMKKLKLLMPLKIQSKQLQTRKSQMLKLMLKKMLETKQQMKKLLQRKLKKIMVFQNLAKQS